MNNRNDFQRHLSSKNVRNARSDFQAVRNTATSSESDNNIGRNNSSSGSGGDHTSTESVMREESNLSFATNDELDMISLTEGAIGAGDSASSLDYRKPSSTRITVKETYDEDGNLSRSFFTKSQSSNNATCPCCCECYHTTMRKYKGMWFLLCTVLILIMITAGIVLGTNEDDDENDDDSNIQPTISPTSKATMEPTSDIIPTDNSYWCGINRYHAENECSLSCSGTGLDSECPFNQFCWSDISTCNADKTFSHINDEAFLSKDRQQRSTDLLMKFPSDEIESDRLQR